MRGFDHMFNDEFKNVDTAGQAMSQAQSAQFNQIDRIAMARQTLSDAIAGQLAIMLTLSAAQKAFNQALDAVIAKATAAHVSVIIPNEETPITPNNAPQETR